MIIIIIIIIILVIVIIITLCGYVKKNIGRIVNIPIVSYFFVIRFVSITYWKSYFFQIKR